MIWMFECKPEPANLAAVYMRRIGPFRTFFRLFKIKFGLLKNNPLSLKHYLVAIPIRSLPLVKVLIYKEAARDQAP
jgi:hypothetical protein